MSSTIHLVDSATPGPLLAQARRICRHDDPIVFIGPSGPSPQAQGLERVHAPLGLARLAGLRLGRYLPGRAVAHAWSLRAAGAGRTLARREGLNLLASINRVPRDRRRDRLVSALQANELDLTVPSEIQRRALLARDVQAEAVHVLGPVADLPERTDRRRHDARGKLGFTDKNTVLVAPGAMHDATAGKFAIWVHVILHHFMPDVRLLLPGDGPARPRVRFFLESAGLPDLTWMGSEQVGEADALAAADIAMVLPRKTGCTHALAAAMGAGLPIVAADVPDLAEWAPAEEAALLVEPAQPRLAAAAAVRLVDDAPLAESLSARARAIAAERMSVDACRSALADIHAEVYAEIL